MKFSCILLDPPWRFNTYSAKGRDRCADKHYPVMSLKDICNIPIQKITEKDCIMFMWATSPMFKYALQAIDSYRFTFKTFGFVWIKTNKDGEGLSTGCGYYTRSNAEYCLIATQGHPKRISASVHQVVMAPRTKHSEKPPEVRKRIVQLMGDLPRIELFARVDTEKVDGWRCIGDSLSGRDICQDIDIVSQL